MRRLVMVLLMYNYCRNDEINFSEYIYCAPPVNVRNFLYYKKLNCVECSQPPNKPSGWISQQFSDKYGEVFTIYLGSRPVVVVTGYKQVKEVYLDKADDFLGRGDLPAWNNFYKSQGVIFTDVLEWWRELRGFSISSLRDLGFGKSGTEDGIQEEAHCLVEELKKTKESFIDPQLCLRKAVCNINLSTMFGNRHEYEDKDLVVVLSCIQNTFAAANSSWVQMYDVFPCLMNFIPGPHHKIFQFLDKLGQYVDNRVNINQKNLDPAHPGSYVDAFLIKMEKEKANPNSVFTRSHLLSSALQIFFAGVETTSTTLYYSLLILLKYPDICAKFQKEIDHVIGPNRCSTIKDKSSMPYTEALIHEIHRFIDLLPLGVPRKTVREVTLKGYKIPQGINILPLLSSVLKDPTCFKYPAEFNPENFLNEKGEFQKNGAYMPFAAGKRNCLGEPMARMMLFLFLTTIFQNFDLKSSVPFEELDITPLVSGFGNLPRNYKCAFITR
ncbi:cytochrome P450 2G1-like isoform X2 [Aquarana catesbeiana]|uniref:cytochrome P450 2G1-like isoform X2 n=1 Tax=Aquarana catesbeiana TaxID=8400 RepID=UPI003CC97CE7